MKKLRDFRETRIRSKQVYRGRLLDVREDRVRLPDGSEAQREYVRHPGAVVIIPFLSDDVLLLEWQFRYPHHRHFYELPAGKIDAGETPLRTARRELEEETGYRAKRWQHVATIHPTIAYSDEHIEIFTAEKLTHVGAVPDDGEFLEVIELPLQQALEWVRLSRITDVKTVIGLLWAERIRSGAWKPGARASRRTSR